MSIKIKDSQFREAAEHRHPEFEPYLVFNDKAGAPTIYFKSTYNDSPLAKRLNQLRPDLYYWPEKPENMVIEVKKGGHARLPHSQFTVNTSTGEPATYSIRTDL